MNQLFSLLVAIGMVSLTARGQTAAYTTGFDTTVYNIATDVAGQDGWRINTPMQMSSFFVNLNRNSAAALGGYYDAPATPEVRLAHDYRGSLGGTTFSVDFAMIKSTVLAPGFDTFGYSFSDGAGNPLLRVAFEPNGGTTNSLEIVYYDAYNVRTSTGYDLFYGSIYHMVVTFAQSGPDARFSIVVGNSLGSVPLVSDTPMTGAGSAVVGSVGVTFDVDGGLASSSGDNFLIFDNLSISGPAAPEPVVPTMTLNPSNEPVFSFAGVPGTAYRLLRSTTLESVDWSTEATTTAPENGVAELIDPNPPIARAFYRVEPAAPGS